MFRGVMVAAVAACGLLIPATAQEAQPKATGGAPGQTAPTKTSPKAKAAPSGPLDLNTASEKELDSLPGVGPATAKKIVQGRPYNSVDDLAKAGVASKQIETIRPLVTVSGGTAANAPAGQAASGGGPGKVWVNLETKVYHRQGDPWYGKTKKGTYMSEGDAIRAGYRAAK
jgi:hypothetical protein